MNLTEIVIELVEVISSELEAFNLETEKALNSNKAAAERARKISLNLLKKLRAESMSV